MPRKSPRNLLEVNRRLRQELQEATERAKRDEVTGLYRRWYLIDCIEKAINALSKGLRSDDIHLGDSPTPARRPVFIMLDIKNFSQFNDLPEGEVAGDVALQQVGSAMKKMLREGDKLGRIGGDEFGLWLPAMTPDAVRVRIDEMNRSLAEEDERLSLYFSFCFFESGMDFQELYRAAAAALRNHKRAEKAASSPP